MAYKFQLGAAKLGGAITSTGVVSGSSLAADSALAVGEGGTGATTLTDGGILLGSGTGAITAMSVLADGEMIVGDGTTDPQAESGPTLRASIGVSIGSQVQAYDVDLDTLSGMATGAPAALAALSAAEIAILDDLTATTAELNHVAGVTGGIQTQLAGKQPIDAELTELATMASATAAALADLTSTEVGFLDGAVSTNDSGVKKVALLDATNGLTIAGDLTVGGDLTYVNTTNLRVTDAKVVFADGAAALATGQGFYIGKDDGTTAQKASFAVGNGTGTNDAFVSSLNLVAPTVFASTALATNDWEITSAHISGNLPITASGFAGNASSATALQSAKAIGGVNFDGSAAITPQQIDIADEESTDADRLIMFADANGAQRPKNDGDFHYNPNSGLVTANAFAGNGSALTNITSTGVKLSSGKLDSASNATGSVGSLRYVIADSGAAAMLVNLPSIAPADAGTMIIIKRVGGNNVTISSANTSQTVEGSNQDITLETNGAAVTLMASDEGDATHGGWRIV